MSKEMSRLFDEIDSRDKDAEIERLNALVAMQSEALKETKPYIGAQAVKYINAGTFHGKTAVKLDEEKAFAALRILTSLHSALSASSSTVAKWEAEKLEPLQRQVAMLVEHLTDSQMHDIGRMQFERNKEALSNTQATAETYDREHDAKVLKEAFGKAIKSYTSEREARLVFANLSDRNDFLSLVVASKLN